MIEAGVVMRDLTLENPIRAIREVSHDLDRAPPGAARQRPRGQRAGDPAGVPRPRPRDFVDAHGAAHRRRQARPRPVGARRCEAVEQRRPRPGRARDRLGDQAAADRALPRQARPAAVVTRGSPSSTSPTTTSTAAAACTTCSQRRGPGRPGDHRPRDLRGQGGAAADHPGPAARRLHPRARRSAAATSPSTGCTSSSTTRRSAPCCARTRSGAVDERVERLIAEHVNAASCR